MEKSGKNTTAALHDSAAALGNAAWDEGEGVGKQLETTAVHTAATCFPPPLDMNQIEEGSAEQTAD